MVVWPPNLIKVYIIKFLLSLNVLRGKRGLHYQSTILNVKQYMPHFSRMNIEFHARNFYRVAQCLGHVVRHYDTVRTKHCTVAQA